MIDSEIRGQVEERLQRRSYALKTEYMCVNDTETDGKVNMSGAEIFKVDLNPWGQPSKAMNSTQER